jgi:hypothetical protein
VVRPPRSRPLLLLAVSILVLAAWRPACAEEALVLENGTVLRGTVVREDEQTLLVRLSGLGVESKITVARDRIVQRFATNDPRRAAAVPPRIERMRSGEPPIPRTLSGPGIPLVRTANSPPASAVDVTSTIEPIFDEPFANQESFFERTARRAMLAFPGEPASRAVIAALALIVLLALVALGGKMADIQGLTLGRSTLLAVLLGTIVTVDCVWAETLLRADHAVVILPLELLGWVACAASSVRCGIGRSVLLLAFVIFSGVLATFSAGAVLVSV